MVDSDGLWLYRSIRGTSNLESLHQKLTKAFGHKRAGPQYSDNLLCHFRHRYNWRASERNRPFFPRVGHYNGLALDTINDLYEALFGMPKFPYWCQQGRFTTKSSLYGIVPLHRKENVNEGEDVSPVDGLTKSLNYLALRQESSVPYTPIKTKEEKTLYANLIARALRESKSMSATATFNTMEGWWQKHAHGTNKIYRKNPEHLAQYYKQWRKKKSRREAIKTAKADGITAALEYTPPVLNYPTVMAPTALPARQGAPVAADGNDFAETRFDLPEADDDESMRMEVDLTLADEEQLDENISILEERPDSPRPREFVTSRRGRGRGRVVPAAAPPARRARTCQVANCSNPTACPGRSNRGNCQSLPVADRTQRKRPKSSVPN
jgi:hypothetical protein